MPLPPIGGVKPAESVSAKILRDALSDSHGRTESAVQFLPLCSECIARLEPLPELFCKRCGTPLPDGGAHCPFCLSSKRILHKCRMIRSALLFNPQSRSLIHHLKYKGKTNCAHYLAGFMAEALERFGELSSFTYLVAVPVSKKRQEERGYNQSLLLARELAGITGLDIVEGALEKIRETRPQAGLSKIERINNLDGAFVADGQLRGKSALLIDDVATTGATLEACAAALVKSGAMRAAALTVAREDFKSEVSQ